MRNPFLLFGLMIFGAGLVGCGAATGTTDPGEVPAMTAQEEQAAADYEKSLEIDPATGSPKTP